MEIKKYLFFMGLILGQFVYGQSYSFTNTSGGYTGLSTGITLTSSTPWDDEIYRIPIGFNFKFYDTFYDSLDIDTYGLLVFDENLKSHYYVGFYADLMDRGTTSSLSKVWYKVSGFAPNRILTIEFKNCGFYSDPNLTSYVNFQMVLYEGINRIETKMGPNSVLNPNDCYDGDTGPLIGIYAEDNVNSTYYGTCLQGNPANPSYVWLDPDVLTFLNGTPPTNRIYRFNYSAVFTDVDAIVENELYSVFPNPTNGVVNILCSDNSNNRFVEIYSLTGKLYYTFSIPALNNQLFVELDNGCYFLKIFENGEVIKNESIIVAN